MGNGTKTQPNMFSAGERLRECRELRGFTREELIEAVELLPDNNGKTRSEKQIGYIENGTRPLSKEYAHLLASALHVRVEYLLLIDDYKTEIERIGAHATSRNEKRDLIAALMRLHCYEIKDVTNETPVLTDEQGREYQVTTFALISPKGTVRHLSTKDLLSIIEKIDDYVEYQCATQFRKLIDGVRNIYDWEV